MGALMSLSKSGTSYCLSASEYALLVFALLVVVGLIGENKLPWWHHRLKIFEILVTIGCAGELLADGGVFVFSRHLETLSDLEVGNAISASGKAIERAAKSELRAAELEAIIQPRYLTDEQEQQIIDGLKSLAGRDLLIGSHWLDAESARFARQIKTALNAAGIGAKPGSPEDLIGKWPRVAPGLFNAREFHGPDIHVGIEVWGKDRQFVARTLKNITHLDVTMPEGPSPFDFEADSLLSVFVGLKPLPQVRALEKSVAIIAQQRSGAVGTIYDVPVVNGVATPNLALGSTQRILLTSDTIVATPTNSPSASNASLTWTLNLDQDKIGKHSVTMAPSYNVGYPLSDSSCLPNTRATTVFTTDHSGRSSPTGLPIMNIPLPY